MTASMIAATHWEKWTAIGTLVLAVATIGLAVVALFGDSISRKLQRARLGIEIVPRPPDVHQIAIANVVDGSVIGNAIYVRARVSHLRGPSADNAEIVARRVWDVNGNERRLRQSFLPLSLVWSHFGGVTMRIPEGLFRHCDVGRFLRDDRNRTVFLLSTVVQPNIVSSGVTPNLLPAGTYEIELLLTGDNTPYQVTNWRLSFSEQWSDDESTMLNRISIERIAPAQHRAPLDMPIVTLGRER